MNSVLTNAFDTHGLRTNNDELIDVGEMINVLSSIFNNVEKARKDAICVPQCVDLTLNWLLNVYDRYRTKLNGSLFQIIIHCFVNSSIQLVY